MNEELELMRTATAIGNDKSLGEEEKVEAFAIALARAAAIKSGIAWDALSAEDKIMLSRRALAMMAPSA